MKTFLCLTLALLVALVNSQWFPTNMCGVSNGVNVFVNRDGDHYKLRLRDLKPLNNLNHFPNITCSGGGYTNCPVDNHGNTYCYTSGQIQKKNRRGDVVATVNIAASNYAYNLLLIDPYVPNTLHITTWGCMRGCTNQVYNKIDMDDLSIVAGPITLPNSAISGCPVEPTGCAVFDIQFTTAANDYVIYGYRYDQNLTYYVSAVNTRHTNSGIDLYQLPQHV
jgi:hypothetical protein